jgi:hypothetical protein
MIRNPDGTPYQVSGSLNVYNGNEMERELLNTYDAEIIKINGTPLYYYEFLADANTIDPTYYEARGALYSPVPVLLYAYYDPITSQNYQNMFGIDSPNMTTFELNYQATQEAIGHLPLVGSRLFTPHRGENWRIIQRGAGDWKLWGQIRLILECEQFQESLTRGEGRVTQNTPPYKVN